MSKHITLTQANDEGFDPEKFNFDIKNMSNVKVYCVLQVVELVKEGHLHYVKLEFIEGDMADPKSDPMIVGTISRFIEQKPVPALLGDSTKVLDHQWRVMWDNKLWRPLDDDAATLLECFQGIDKDRMTSFANKLASGKFRQDLAQKIIDEVGPTGWKNT